MTRKASTSGPVTIWHAALRARPVVATAVADLGQGLTHMTGAQVALREDAQIDGREIILTLTHVQPPRENHPDALGGDSFSIARLSDGSLSIRSASERGLIRGAASLLVELGANFPAGALPLYPRIELERIRNLEP